MSSISTQSGLPVGAGNLRPLMPDVIPLTVIADAEVGKSFPLSSKSLGKTMFDAFF